VAGKRELISLFISSLKGALLAGTLVLAPLGITLWIFVRLVGLADSLLDLLPEAIHPEHLVGFDLPGLGLVMTLLIVTWVGYATRVYAGRRVVELYEAVLQRVPLASGMYNGLKQLIETVLSKQGRQFRQVVMVEYPRRGVYCLAFLTNESAFLELGDDPHATDLVSIFLPTTPNPTSGFYLLVPRDDLRTVDLTVEEAFKLIMSAGIVTPENNRSATPFHLKPRLTTTA